MAVDLGNGTLVVFGTSSFAMNIIDVSGPSIERGSVGTSHMGTTTAMTFVPDDLYDGGSIDMTVQYDPTVTPPITGAAEVVTITPAGDTSNTITASCFLTSFTPEFKVGELMQASLTLKASGAVGY